MSETKYQTTASNIAPLTEQRETQKYSHTIDTFVLSPAGQNALYGALFILGSVLMLGAPVYGYWLMVLGAPFFGGGVFGWLMLQRRLTEYKPHSNKTTIERLPETAVNVPRREISVNGKSIILDRPPKTVSYAGDSYQFAGKAIDVLSEMVAGGHLEVRRDTSPDGPGWVEAGVNKSVYARVRNIMIGRGYIGKNEGDKLYRWTVRGITEFLELDPP